MYQNLPAQGAIVVTPSDTVALAVQARGISFAEAGDITVVFVGGAVASPTLIPSGTLAPGLIHPMQVTYVMATGTDSNTIVAWT